MRIFLTGVSCVGKTTTGTRLAVLLDCEFFDLDTEIEIFFGTSIERLQKKFLTSYSFRIEASKALKHLLACNDSKNSIIALPPSGLMDSYWRIVKKAGGIIVVLHDEPKNILNRITFYDIDSKLIDKKLSDRERHLYLKEIKKDITYYGKSYRRAHFTFSIAGLGPNDAAHNLHEVLTVFSRNGNNPRQTVTDQANPSRPLV